MDAVVQTLASSLKETSMSEHVQAVPTFAPRAGNRSTRQAAGPPRANG